MPSPPPIAYCFEGEPLAEAPLRTALGVPAGWVRRLSPTLFAPGSGASGPSLRFVGVLGAGRGLLVALPKYLRGRSAAQWAAPATGHAAEADLVLRVLARFGRQAPTRLPEADTAEAAATDFFAGEPAIALALVEDYQSQGYWHEPQRELTTWPGARPDWPRTVARARPLLTESGPLYPVRYGYRQPPGAVASVLEHLHRWAVRHCIETYRGVLPGLAAVSYDPDAAEERAEIGEPDYLRYLVTDARRRAFRDSHLRTLDLLAQLLGEESSTDAERPIALFGTTSFHRVWEETCRAAFADRSAELLARLPVPTWHAHDGPVYRNARNRLIPDVVAYDDHTLFIADAKYYAVTFSPGGQVQGGPGMPDITKQLLYEQALTALLPSPPGQPLRTVQNVFLLPTDRAAASNEQAASWHWGHIESNIPGWEGRRVAVWLVPPNRVFAAYLGGEVMG